MTRDISSFQHATFGPLFKSQIFEVIESLSHRLSRRWIAESQTLRSLDHRVTDCSAQGSLARVLTLGALDLDESGHRLSRH